MISSYLDLHTAPAPINRQSDYGKIDLDPQYQIEVSPVITSMLDSESSKPLPKGYQPSDHDVVCGRGKGHYNQPGNKKFRSLILDRLAEYQTLRTRIDKTVFLNKIIDEVRSQNNGQAHFVRKLEGGIWEKLGDELAREKVGHAIREALAPRYKVKSTERCCSQSDKKGAKKKTSHDTCLDKQAAFQKIDMYDTVELNSLCEDAFEPLPITSSNLSITYSSFFGQMIIPEFARSSSVLSADCVYL